jgi:hypothetical protein
MTEQRLGSDIRVYLEVGSKVIAKESKRNNIVGMGLRLDIIRLGVQKRIG